MVEARVPLRRRLSSLARPGVQADVVVVASGGQKRRPGQAKVRSVGDNVEAQHVVVEGRSAIEIGDAQVDVSDADVRVKLGMVHFDSKVSQLSRGQWNGGATIRAAYLRTLS